MIEAREKLKAFIEDNFDFDSLKQAGFFPKGTRRTDYEKIAERICQWFGFKTIYEYKLIEMEQHQSVNVVTGKFSDEINEKGELVQGGGFLLDTIQTAFECPVCSCPQDADDHKEFAKAKIPVVGIKCKGCKRKLRLYTDIFTGGGLTVTEGK